MAIAIKKPRPWIRPLKLKGENKKNPGGGRGNQDRGSKTKQLKIHETVVIRPDGVPEKWNDYAQLHIDQENERLYSGAKPVDRDSCPCALAA